MTTGFLVCAVFFPRLTLFFSYVTGSIPFNTTPFAVDVIGSLFLPRLLIAAWLYDSHKDVHWAWSAILVVLTIAEWSGGRRAQTTRRRNDQT